MQSAEPKIIAQEMVADSVAGDATSPSPADAAIDVIPAYDLKSQSENSYLGRIGKFIEPVMRPLGMDWRASVAVLSGVSAKEIVVSTLGVLYSVEDAESDSSTLSAKLLSSGNYSRAGALAMIIFILLYLPCLATVSAIAHEAGGWRWALFSVVYNTVLAWILAFAAYHIGLWIGL